MSKGYEVRGRGGKSFFALKNLTLEILPGETLCLIGPSGCGKTTTLKLINRLLEPTQGKVLVSGIDVQDRDLRELRRSMGYVTQSGGLFPHLTASQNIALLGRYQGWSSERTQQRVFDLLELVGLSLTEHGNKYPCELSGGQKQRVCVARALLLDPEIILMDEPFSALDPVVRFEIQKEFLSMESFVQKTIVVVTHDMEEAFRLGDRVALLMQGELVQLGTEKEFRESPANDFVREFLRKQYHDEDTGPVRSVSAVRRPHLVQG